MQIAVFLSTILTLIYGVEAYMEVDLELRELHHENDSLKRDCHVKGFLHQKPVDCAEIFENGFEKNGVYNIYPKSRIIGCTSIQVFCDMETVGGGWTVIQRRGDYKRPDDYFYKNWSQYKSGFGNLKKDFWFGNDYIHVLSNQKKYVVRFELGTENETAYAEYDSFWIENEVAKYRLHISGYSGTAGDSMTYHHNMNFSTKDSNNNPSATSDCVQIRKGGWWYNDCHSVNLNGLYKKDNCEGSVSSCVSLLDLQGHGVSLSTVEIKIRPYDF